MCGKAYVFCDGKLCLRVKEIWNGENNRDRTNALDPYALGVVKKNIVVRHISQNFNCMFSLLTEWDRVIEVKRCSHDLLQCGLEIPCFAIINFYAKAEKIKINRSNE